MAAIHRHVARVTAREALRLVGVGIRVRVGIRVGVRVQVGVRVGVGVRV